MIDPEVERIHERLDTLTDTVSSRLIALTSAVSSIQATCKSCRATVGRHEEAIHGNGRDGLRQRMTGLSTIQESHAASIQSLKSTRSRVIWWLCSMGGSALAGALAMGWGGN